MNFLGAGASGFIIIPRSWKRGQNPNVANSFGIFERFGRGAIDVSLLIHWPAEEAYLDVARKMMSSWRSGGDFSMFIAIPLDAPRIFRLHKFPKQSFLIDPVVVTSNLMKDLRLILLDCGDAAAGYNM